MRRFEYLFSRLRRLEPDPVIREPWPPGEGSLSWAILRGREAEGLATPPKPDGESTFMYLARLEAKRLWGDHHAPD